MKHSAYKGVCMSRQPNRAVSKTTFFEEKHYAALSKAENEGEACVGGAVQKAGVQGGD